MKKREPESSHQRPVTDKRQKAQTDHCESDQTLERVVHRARGAFILKTPSFSLVLLKSADRDQILLN